MRSSIVLSIIAFVGIASAASAVSNKAAPPTANAIAWLDASSIDVNNHGEVRNDTNGKAFVINWYPPTAVKVPPATQLNFTLAPQYIDNALNGLPVVFFNSTSFLSYAPGFQEFNGLTFFGVIRFRTTGLYPNVRLFDFGTGGTADNLALYQSSTQLTYQVNAEGFSTRAYAYSQSINQFDIYQVTQYLNGTGVIKVNNRVVGSQNGLITPRQVLRTQNFIHKSSIIESQTQLDIAEFILYNVRITDAEAADVYKYLSQKWSAGPLIPLTGLVSWLDATALNATDPKQVRDLEYVVEWRSPALAAGLALPPATQVSPAIQPRLEQNFFNNLPVVRFDDPASYLSFAAGFGNFVSGLTAFAVVAFGATGEFTRVFDFSTDVPELDGFAFTKVSTTANIGFQVYYNGTEADVQAPNSIIYDKPTIWMMSLSSNQYTSIYRNNSILNSGYVRVPRNVTRTANYIHRSVNQDKQGPLSVGELIIYNRYLTTVEITAVYGYLSSKWAGAPSERAPTAPTGF